MLILKINFIAKFGMYNISEKHMHSKYIALHHTLASYRIMVAGSGAAITQCLKGNYITHALPMCTRRGGLATRNAVYYNLQKKPFHKSIYKRQNRKIDPSRHACAM